MATGDTAETPHYDAGQRRTTAHLNRAHPHWLVLWGAHSRLFWAYPLFDVPPGTIVSAATPGDLTAHMRHIEMITHYGPPPYRQPPPG